MIGLKPDFRQQLAHIHLITGRLFLHEQRNLIEHLEPVISSGKPNDRKGFTAEQRADILHINRASRRSRKQIAVKDYDKMAVGLGIPSRLNGMQNIAVEKPSLSLRQPYRLLTDLIENRTAGHAGQLHLFVPVPRNDIVRIISEPRFNDDHREFRRHPLRKRFLPPISHLYLGSDYHSV